MKIYTQDDVDAMRDRSVTATHEAIDEVATMSLAFGFAFGVIFSFMVWAITV